MQKLKGNTQVMNNINSISNNYNSNTNTSRN